MNISIKQAYVAALLLLSLTAQPAVAIDSWITWALSWVVNMTPDRSKSKLSDLNPISFIYRGEAEEGQTGVSSKEFKTMLKKDAFEGDIIIKSLSENSN